MSLVVICYGVCMAQLPTNDDAAAEHGGNVEGASLELARYLTMQAYILNVNLMSVYIASDNRLPLLPFHSAH